MGRRIKRINLWLRRKAHLPLLIIGVLVVLLLFINEDTSLKLNMEYEKEIKSLKQEIRMCQDSALYYRQKHDAVLKSAVDLEYAAREQYHMQRPTEDVYIIK